MGESSAAKVGDETRMCNVLVAVQVLLDRVVRQVNEKMKLGK